MQQSQPTDESLIIQVSAKIFLNSLYKTSSSLASLLQRQEKQEILRNAAQEYLNTLYEYAMDAVGSESSLPSPITFNRLPSGLSNTCEEELRITAHFLENVNEHCATEASQTFLGDSSTGLGSFFPLNETVLESCIRNYFSKTEPEIFSEEQLAKDSASRSLSDEPNELSEASLGLEKEPNYSGQSLESYDLVGKASQMVRDTDKYLKEFMDAAFEDRYEGFRRSISLPEKLNTEKAEDFTELIPQEATGRVHFKRCESIKVDEKLLGGYRGNKLAEAIEEVLEAEVHDKVETLASELESDAAKVFSAKKRFSAVDGAESGDSEDSDNDDEEDINVEALVESVLLDVDSQTRSNLTIFNRCHSLDLDSLLKLEKTEEPETKTNTDANTQSYSQKKSRVRRELIEIIEETLKEDQEKEKEIEVRRRSISEFFLYEIEDAEEDRQKSGLAERQKELGNSTDKELLPAQRELGKKQKLRVLSENEEQGKKADCLRHPKRTRKFQEDQENIAPSARNILANSCESTNSQERAKRNFLERTKASFHEGAGAKRTYLEAAKAKFEEGRKTNSYEEARCSESTRTKDLKTKAPFLFQEDKNRLEEQNIPAIETQEVSALQQIQACNLGISERGTANANANAQLSYRLPHIYREVDIKNFISVNHDNINFGVLVPGNIIEENFDIVNLSKTEPIVLKVQIKCFNPELDALDEYVFSIRKLTVYDYNERFILLLVPDSSIRLKLAVKVPNIKQACCVLGCAELSLQGFDDSFWRIPISCYVELPRVICPKELYVERFKCKVLKLAAKTGRKQECKIPVKNLSIMNLCLESEVLCPSGCPWAGSYEIAVFPPILNVNNMAQCVINLIVRPLYTSEAKQPPRGEELKRILLVKVKNSSVIISFPVCVEFY